MDQVSLNKSTSFMGAVVDEMNGPSDERIRVALDHTHRLLTIQKFIEVTKFAMDPVMVNYFWQVVVDGRPTHMGRSTLEWFGYEGEYYNQKQKFTLMLKRNNIPYKELKHDDKDVSLYPTIEEEIRVQQPATVVKQKWLVMDPDDLKQAIMKLNTKNGNTIRAYYISLEKLVRLYAEYCLYHNDRVSKAKIDDLTAMVQKMELQNVRQETMLRSLGVTMEEVRDQNEELQTTVDEVKDQNKAIQDKLNIAVKDRAPLPIAKAKQERFVLIKRNDPQFEPYYVIRAQDTYVKAKLRAQQALFEHMIIVMDLKCNPNSKTLFVRIKDKLKGKGVVFRGNSIDLNGTIDEEELVKEMRAINDEKYEI